MYHKLSVEDQIRKYGDPPLLIGKQTIQYIEKFPEEYVQNGLFEDLIRCAPSKKYNIEEALLYMLTENIKPSWTKRNDDVSESSLQAFIWKNYPNNIRYKCLKILLKYRDPLFDGSAHITGSWNYLLNDIIKKTGEKRKTPWSGLNIIYTDAKDEELYIELLTGCGVGIPHQYDDAPVCPIRLLFINFHVIVEYDKLKTIFDNILRHFPKGVSTQKKFNMFHSPYSHLFRSDKNVMIGPKNGPKKQIENYNTDEYKHNFRKALEFLMELYIFEENDYEVSPYEKCIQEGYPCEYLEILREYEFGPGEYTIWTWMNYYKLKEDEQNYWRTLEVIMNHGAWAKENWDNIIKNLKDRISVIAHNSDKGQGNFVHERELKTILKLIEDKKQERRNGLTVPGVLTNEIIRYEFPNLRKLEELVKKRFN